jgi:hypothetical protein
MRRDFAFSNSAQMKTILVHMMRDDGRRRRLATALALASAHRALLVGLFTKSPHLTPSAIVGRAASSAFLREMEAGLRDQEQSVKSEFDAAVAKAGVSAEWQHHDGQIMDGLAFHSHGRARPPARCMTRCPFCIARHRSRS